jgi:hypothetical protein
MSFRRRAAIGIAALSSAALAVTGVVGIQGAGAAASAKMPTVTVHVNKNIKLSRGTVHAGKVEFKVVTSNGNHIVQIARLHKGYSLQKAGADLQKAFGGDTKAIKRVDHRISFRGGAGTHPGKPGWMTTNLNKAGQYVLLDQNGSGLSFLKVKGQAPKGQAGPAPTGNLRVFTYGFAPVGGPLPANGWVRLANHSDQPHFVEMEHVKQGTTGKDVKKFIKSGANSAPPFALHGHADSGVISPGSGQNLKLDVAPGKYLVACFWPDIMTGMPHFFMGMWRLVQVK